MFNLLFFIQPHFFFQAVFEEQRWSLGMVGGGLSLGGRQHLRANLNLGVRPTTWPLQSAQKHKETKTFAKITTTQRGTCRAICVHHCAVVIFKILGFYCIKSCCQLHFTLRITFSGPTNFFIFLQNYLFSVKWQYIFSPYTRSHSHWVIIVPLLHFSEELQQTAAWLIS